MKFATNPYNTTHLTLGMLLHYFGKLKSQIFCKYWRSYREFKMGTFLRHSVYMVTTIDCMVRLNKNISNILRSFSTDGRRRSEASLRFTLELRSVSLSENAHRSWNSSPSAMPFGRSARPTSRSWCCLGSTPAGSDVIAFSPSPAPIQRKSRSASLTALLGAAVVGIRPPSTDHLAVCEAGPSDALWAWCRRKFGVVSTSLESLSTSEETSKTQS